MSNMKKTAREVLQDIANANPIHRKISVKGKLSLMRNNQTMILSKHYPTSLNPHKNPKAINSLIRKSRNQDYI